MTKAEACLWKYALRAKKMKGYEFRRERPILNFIADFMCFELNLVIEVDGITHTWEETIEKDIRKDKALAAIGVTVLRFPDNYVLRDMEGVIREIKCWIEAKEASMREGTSPLPSFKGG